MWKKKKKVLLYFKENKSYYIVSSLLSRIDIKFIIFPPTKLIQHVAIICKAKLSTEANWHDV